MFTEKQNRNKILTIRECFVKSMQDVIISYSTEEVLQLKDVSYTLNVNYCKALLLFILLETISVTEF